MEKSGQKIVKVKVTHFWRIICILSTSLGVIGFLLFALLLTNFIQDHPILNNLPSVHNRTNTIFHLCSSKYTKSICSLHIPILNDLGWHFQFVNETFNVLLMSIFWFQHIIFAKLNLKRFIIQRFPQYIFIERALYNIGADFTAIFMMFCWNSTNQYVYDAPQELKYVFYIFQASGIFLMVKAVSDMNRYADIIGLRFMKKVIHVDYIDYYERYEPRDQGKIAVTKLYSLMRHPQQAGVILILLFSGVRFSLDRIVLISYMILGIVIGVMQEEKQLERLFPSYTEYKQNVPTRFIPNIFALFRSKNEQKLK